MHTEEILEVKPLDMRLFNHRSGYETALPLRGTFNSDRRNAIFQNYLDHVDAESIGDYDYLMSTCSKKYQKYAIFFSPHGQKAGVAQSYEELEKQYHDLVASNTYLIHREVDKLIVGDDELLVDGIVHQLIPGAVAAARGVQLDPKKVYQFTARIAVIFIFDDDGLGAGEQAYSKGVFTADDYTEVDSELVPEQFWNNPLTGPFKL